MQIIMRENMPIKERILQYLEYKKITKYAFEALKNQLWEKKRILKDTEHKETTKKKISTIIKQLKEYNYSIPHAMQEWIDENKIEVG